jgi:hypothetical protein
VRPAENGIRRTAALALALRLTFASSSQSVREASDTRSAELSDIGAEAADRLKHYGTDNANAAQDKVKF